MGLSAPAPLGRRRRRGGAFRVPQLFANNEAGAWYDPSDLTAEKVAWRRNLLTWSEDFTNAAWTKTRSSITPNAGTSWDGTATASKLVEDTSTGTHFIRQDISVTAGIPYAVTMYAKAAERSVLFISPDGGSNFFWFDLSNGTTGGSASGSSAIESVGSGWYRCIYLRTYTTTTTAALFYYVSNSTAGVSYTGDGTSGILIDSAQAQQSATATAYQRITDFTSDFLAAFPTHGLYQDAAGTTPVTALGQPVGLVIDSKTGGLANVGAELVTNGGFPVNTTGWTAGNSPVLTVGANGVTIQNNGASAGYLYQAMTTVIGRSYLITGSIVYGGTGFARIEVSTTITNPGGGNINASASGLYRWVFTATAATTYIIIGNRNDTNAAHTYDNISVREVPGVHAIQPTSASRPLLDGRVNLLERTEEFDNAYWTKENVTITANAGVAPDGTTTADLVYPTTSGSSNRWVRRSTTVSGTAAYQMRVAVKASGLTWAYVLDVPGLAGAAWINAQTGAVGTVASGYTATSRSLGNGWYELVVLSPAITGSSMFMPYIGVSDSNNSLAVTASGTNGVLIHGADLRLATDAAYPYQRVAAATDYADVGVPRSFLFDGFDDSLYTASNLDLSGTDKVTVLAGVRKLSDGGAGLIVELSANGDSNNGAFYISASPSGQPAYAAAVRGTSLGYYVPVTYTAPTTNVVAALADIGASTLATEIVPRINGVVDQDGGVGSVGTGNFGSYVLFIGRRNNATAPLNGKAYQLIVRGALTDAATLTQAERFVAQRTGITL